MGTNIAMNEYCESDRLLTEQFTGGLNDDDMSDETLRDITTLENIEEATGEQVLIWACRVGV